MNRRRRREMPPTAAMAIARLPIIRSPRRGRRCYERSPFIVMSLMLSASRARFDIGLRSRPVTHGTRVLISAQSMARLSISTSSGFSKRLISRGFA